jgi:outer membrane receptor protein involved in Fe transport
MFEMFCEKKTVALVIVMLFLVTGMVFGQGIVTGSISGIVLDPQGAVVGGAEVRATQLETNRAFSTISSSGGVVALPSLPPGTYKVIIEAKGFSNYTAQNVIVAVGKDSALGSVRLNVGSSSETVTVEGTAPIVERTTDQLSQTFSTQEVASVPLGNTYDSFVLFTPGVATVGSGGFENTNGAALSINGQRGRSNNFQLDGQNNNDNTIGGPSFFFGNQDAIAELQVVTNFDAEYGRNMGGVVNYVTKGGTNAFHGTGYEFWQGNTFDSLQNQEKSSLFGFCPPGVSPDTGCTKPVLPQYVQNQFGGTIGGPIKRDKIWFFGSANFQRNRSAGAPIFSNGALTPDATGIQQLQAAFPDDPAVAALAQWGPATLTIGNPTFSNVHTESVVGPGNVTVPVEMGELSRSLTQPFNDYEATGRVDFQLTSKDRFFARYLFQQQGQSNLPIGGAAGAQGQIYTVYGRNQQIGLDLTHTFSSSLLNQVRFSYSRALSKFDGGGFPTCLLANQGACPPQIAILDPTFLGVGQFLVFPQGRIINVYELQDNATLLHGKHFFKWGGSYDRQRSPNYGLFEENGLFLYPDFNSYIQNAPVQTQVAYGQNALRFKENDFSLYFQDDWRIKDNLTLNLGLRWEFYQQAGNLLHDESVAREKGPNALWDQTLPLSLTTVPHIPNHYKNFGPVVGFAWTPRMLPRLLGTDRTVVRGGFRIAYDVSYYNLQSNIGGTSPFTNLATINDSTGNPAGLPNVATLDGASIATALFPLAPKGNPGVATELQFGNNFRNPYSEQWNLGVQRQIGNRMAAEVRYVGNHSVGNFQEINGNPDLRALQDAGFGSLIPAGLTPCTNPSLPGGGFTGTDPVTNQPLPPATDQFGNPVGYANCNFSRVIQYANTGYSIYHGLQSQFRLQNWHGFTGQISYTFSKTIDNASEAFSSLSGLGTLFNLSQSPFDVSRAERAVSSYNYPHVLGLLWVYDLPFRRQQAGLLGHLLGGWQINGTYRYTSGQPWTAVQNSGQGLCDPTNFTGGTIDTCRPILSSPSAPFNSVGVCGDATAADCGITNFTTGAATSLSQVRWIINDVTAAKFFGSPFLGVGRNTEHGQPVNTINMSVFKNTRITERLTLQLQAEAFNLFNHQWLGIPNVNVNSANIGGDNQFASSAFNPNGGDSNFGTANIVNDGIGRRRLQLGAKVIF